MSKPLLTTPEVAQLLRCSPATVQRMVKAKRLSAVKPTGKYGRTLYQIVDVETCIRRATKVAVGEQL